MAGLSCIQWGKSILVFYFLFEDYLQICIRFKLKSSQEDNYKVTITTGLSYMYEEEL